MSNFDHVESAIVLHVITSAMPRASAIADALKETGYCLAQDIANDDIPHGVITSRADAFARATDCYIAGDTSATVENLREFWSN